MEPKLKGCLKAIVLELRRQLEGYHDAQGKWQAGDLERRLASIGVRRDRPPASMDELGHLSREDREARGVVDAFLKAGEEAGVNQSSAIGEFVAKSAYTWANRLLALRCMEARSLIDEVILQKKAYGGRSLQHDRLARKSPERCTGEDEGLFAMLFDEFERRTTELPLVFNPKAPEVILRPSVAVLKRCIALLSGTESAKGQDLASDDVFTAPDALGWSYQYWNTDEKDRVFEKVRTKKGAKIEGAEEIISATCIYTEPYMVKFLVQNSLGALWVRMHPESRLPEKWEYFVRYADRVPAQQKSVREISFLDPACGSGHFLIEAFDLLYDMYQEEHDVTVPTEICASILERNLYGIDIDERAVQIAAVALVMKAKEKASSFVPLRLNLVATNIHSPSDTTHLEAFLQKHPEDKELRPALLAIFESLSHSDELGSLLQIEEPVEREFKNIRTKLGGQLTLTGPKKEEDWDAWKTGVIDRLRRHFEDEARAPDLVTAFFGEAGAKGLSLVDALTRRYDVVAANPPYMGALAFGPVLRSHLATYYRDFSADLFAAYIAQSLALTVSGGCVAMVAQRVFWFTDAFQTARRNVLESARLRTYVDIGPGGFEEIAGAKVNTCLFVAERSDSSNKIGAYIRIVDVADKPYALAATIRTRPRDRFFLADQGRLVALPRSTLSYWAPEEILNLLGSDNILRRYASARAGLATGDNPRWTRLWWEIPSYYPSPPGWVACMTGGDSRSYYTSPTLAVLWGENGTLLRGFVDAGGKLRSRPQNTQYYGKEGLTFSKLGGRRVYGKYLPPGYVFLDTSRYLDVAKEYRSWVLATINSRLASYLLTFVAPSLSYTSGDIESLPLPDLKRQNASASDSVIQAIVALRTMYEARSVSSRDFALDRFLLLGKISLRLAFLQDQEQTERLCAVMHTLEGEAESLIVGAYGLSQETIRQAYSCTGAPTGWLPLVGGTEALPEYPPGVVSVPIQAGRYLLNPDGKATSESAELKERLRLLYEAGPGASTSIQETKEVASEDEAYGGETITVTDARINIPAETFVEEVAQELEIHPISVYWLLRELREQDGVLCQPELLRFVQDYVTVLVMRLLGHRWQRQVEHSNPIVARADPNGIIPLTGGTRDRTLMERVRERIAEDFGPEQVNAIEQEFEQVTGNPLRTWLSVWFFERHVSQFKKRPVAWQIQSTPIIGKRGRRGRGNATPAFSCLVYYHCLNVDLLHKLRSQYVGPLRDRVTTELDGLERLSVRTADQDERRVELETILEELRDFDSRLEQVITTGFSSSALPTIAAKEPLDKWTSQDGQVPSPTTSEAFLAQEQRYDPNPNDGVRVNIAPLQKAGLLASDVLAAKDVESAIADRAEWRMDERRWCREGKLRQASWWPWKKTDPTALQSRAEAQR